MRQHVIRNLEQLRTLRSPVRHQIVAEMSLLGECSVRDIAQALQRSQESLQFHMKALEKVGLVERCGSRSTGNRSERVYRLIAKSLKIDTRNKDSTYRSLLADVYGTLFRFADRHLRRTLTESQDVDYGVLQLAARLRPDKARSVLDRLRELKDDILANQDPSAQGTYLVTLSIGKTTKSVE